ncbi:MAG: ABC transporter ATP-binding protein [Bacteroidota bacterium]
MKIISQHISKSYGSVKALDDVSFQVDQGELFGIIGPDGAGKTTLIRILTTLLVPDKGSAWINGFHSVKDYSTIRRILGYMPGKFSLYQDLTVEENLQFFASIFDKKFDKDFDLIKDIYAQLAPFKTRLAGHLSGGMKQKLALCCALIHTPDVLILDEPTTGVDALSRSEFWDMITGLKNKGITTIVSTPYMDETARCDRVALLQAGHILQIDTPARIIESYKRKLFSVKTNDLYAALKDLKAFEETHAVYPFGQTLHLVSKDEALKKDTIEQYLIQAGHKNPEVEPGQPDIEDCFIELMRNG